MNISESSPARGEEYFRYIEKTKPSKIWLAGKKILSYHRGGTPCFFNNIEFMKRNGKVLWLNTSLEPLNQLLLKKKMSRPLLVNYEAGLRSYIYT